jgi:hypothetical protein
MPIPKPKVLAVALEMTRLSLGLTDDLADGIIAKQIVEVAKTGSSALSAKRRADDGARAGEDQRG